MKDREVDRLLAGLEPASPPPGTRDRALAAARAARTHGAKPEDLWTRLWRSRPARLGWAAAVAALIVANLVVSVQRSPQSGVSHAPALASVGSGETELIAIAELPPLRLDVTPAAEIFERLSAAPNQPSQLSPRRPS
jgi:hypothetical protein